MFTVRAANVQVTKICYRVALHFNAFDGNTGNGMTVQLLYIGI